MSKVLGKLITKYGKYLMITPVTITYIVFLVIPTAMLLLLSFNTGQRTTFDLSQATFANYVKVVSNPTFYEILMNTFGMSLLTAFLTFLIVYPVAYFLAFKIENVRLQGIILFLLLAMYWIDWSVRSLAWLPILGEQGLVNYILMSLGIIKEPIKLLFSRITLLIIWIQTNLLFMLFPTYLALSRINPELIYTAKALGANDWKAFWHITFKLSLPGVTVGLIFVFVSTLGDYATPSLWAGGLQTLGLTVHHYASYFMWPLASTYATIMLVISLVLLSLILRISNIKRIFYD